MRTIRPAELNLLLGSQPSLALLDVRTPVEFAEIHVPQARNVPLNVLLPNALFRAGILSKNEPVYLLCRTGARAELAVGKFEKAEFENVVVVDGGTLAWSEAGLPVVRGKARVIGLERQVRIAAGLLVLTGVLLGHFLNPWFIGLSAFVGAGLVFAGVTDFCGMGLLLAKLPWNTTVQS